MGHGPEVERLTAASNSAMVRSSPDLLGVLGRPAGRLGGGLLAVRSRCTTRLHTKELGPVMPAACDGDWVEGQRAAGRLAGHSTLEPENQDHRHRTQTTTPRRLDSKTHAHTGTYVTRRPPWSLLVLGSDLCCGAKPSPVQTWTVPSLHFIE